MAYSYNNPGQTLIANGSIPVAEVMGIANSAFVVNGTSSDFATAVGPFTFKKLTQNSYDNLGNKSIKVQELGNNGTVSYVFMPAALPVSNFSQSDIGNRSFGTQLNVYGKNIMFLQTNFGTNEFTALTSKDYLDSLQKQLLGTYSKSIAIMKNELSIMESSLFCLATGQFYFTDELGKKIQTDPTDPNNLTLGEANMIGSTQAPRLQAKNAFLGNMPQAFLKQELNALSTGLMLFPQSINTFNIGYSLDRLAVVCSLYMRTNLSYALNMGGPTDTNMNLVQNSSYVKPALSQGYNLILTDTNTVPYFQNDIGMVSQENMGSVNGSNTYAGQPLGYGINNICPMSYTKNIVAMTSFEGAIDQYYTNDVPFNPYNISSSKTGYRLGYTGGWGQVHVPNYWGTTYMFLDPKAYCTVFGVYTTSTSNPDCDGTQNISYSVTVNGTSTTYNFTDLTSSQNIAGFDMMIDLGSINGGGTRNPTIGTDDGKVSLTLNGANPSTTNPMYISTVGGQQYCATTDNVGNPYFVYNKVSNGVQYSIVVGYNINQLLTDMIQAQVLLNFGEPGMGYDRYCFPNLPYDISNTIQMSTTQPMSGDNIDIGNSCGLTFAQGAGLRSLRALSVQMLVTNNDTSEFNGSNLISPGTYQLLDLVKIGYNQVYLQPYQYMFSMPNNVPYINNPGYSSNGSNN